MSKIICVLTGLSGLLLAVPAAVLADMELGFAAAEGGPIATVVSVKDGWVVIGDDKAKVLFNPDDNTIAAIDMEEETYIVIDDATADAAQAQITEAMKELESQLEQLPPDQRAMARRMLESRMQPATGNAEEQVRVEISDDERSFAGIDCIMATIQLDGRPKHVVCMAQTDDVGVSESDYESLARAFDRMRDLSSRISGGFTSAFSMDIRALDGFPIYTKNLMRGDSSQLVSVSTDTVDAAAVSIPPGFTRQRIN